MGWTSPDPHGRPLIDPADRQAADARNRCHPDTILGTMAHVDARHGGTVAYLAAMGVTDGQLALLRTRLLDGGGL